jgi:hypothetical protein
LATPSKACYVSTSCERKGKRGRCGISSPRGYLEFFGRGTWCSCHAGERLLQSGTCAYGGWRPQWWYAWCR